MLLKEFVSKDTENKNRLYATCLCPGYGYEYTRQKRNVKTNFSCGTKCSNIIEGKLLEIKCDHCANYFYRSNSKLQNSRSGKHFCCRKCKDSAQSYMLEIMPDHYGSGSDYRKIAFNFYAPVCNRCNFSNINALEVHHKDKDRSNNKVTNLEILCANCHSIEHRGMSRGSD